MSVNHTAYKAIVEEFNHKVELVAVSKTKPNEDIIDLYNAGQRNFAENYVQELTKKYAELPKNICWHFIGRLQTNKVKYIAPFVGLIHSVDSLKLLEEINKQGEKINRVINCLLQVHIAAEETKSGLNEEEFRKLITQIGTHRQAYKNVSVCGLMGVASFTEDKDKVRSEFRLLKSLFNEAQPAFTDPAMGILSMGMSADYKIAIEEGSNLVRIGSLLFGGRK